MSRFALGAFLNRSDVRKATVVLVAAAAMQQAHAEAISPRFTAPLPPTQRVFIDNTNLSAREFFSAYMSRSVEERRYAELYLLGVLDSTEGGAWCNYQTYKTTTIAEVIYSGFVKLEEGKQDLRAAHVIAEMLSAKFPCKGR